MIKKLFDQIRQINAHGQEFWNARKLYKLLGYTEYGKFLPAIERAKESCKSSRQEVLDHFAHVSEMIKIASGTAREAFRKVEDYQLSRYACYLIAQNGDPRKEEIALAQAYFAIQTRRQELQDLLTEDSKRMFLRSEMKYRNKNLAKAAQEAGSEELAANLFRATQAEAKLKRENILGQSNANKAHYDVWKKVRKTIQELGGTMPEKLETPANIKEAKQRLKVRGQELL